MLGFVDVILKKLKSKYLNVLKTPMWFIMSVVLIPAKVLCFYKGSVLCVLLQYHGMTLPNCHFTTPANVFA